MPLDLHYDTKLLWQKMKEGRELKEYLAVVANGPNLKRPHILTVPGPDDDTAETQLLMTYNILEEKDICYFVRSLIYDTPAVNTGRFGGTVRLLQTETGGRG